MVIKVCLDTGHILEHEISGNDLDNIKIFERPNGLTFINIMDVYGNEMQYNLAKVVFMNLGMQGKSTKKEMRLNFEKLQKLWIFLYI